MINITPYELFVFFVTTFGSALALLIAVGQILQRKKQINNYLLFVLCFLLAVVQFEVGYSKWIVNDSYLFPNLFHLLSKSISMVFGPLVYIYFRSICDLRYETDKKQRLHFVVPLFLIVLHIVFVFLVLGELSRINIREHPFTKFAGFSFNGLLVVYCLFFLKDTFPAIMAKKTETKALVRSALFIVILIILQVAFRRSGFFYIAHILLSSTLMIAFLIGYRYPDFTQILRQETEKLRYAQSRIENLDTHNIILKINRLLKNEKIYQDEDISLNHLAGKLDITSHQLSEILNTKFEKSFFNFINDFRVDEAKELLLYSLDLSITDIAYQTGFKSVSSFYRSFNRKFGQAPGNFRKSTG